MESMEYKRMDRCFIDWFNNNLIVGAYPLLNSQYFDSHNYDIIINVSDELYPNIEHQLLENDIRRIYWFPMNEVNFDIGMNSIYGALVILFNSFNNNERVYLHCHAGVNRSQIIRHSLYYMMNGKHLNSDDNRLIKSCDKEFLPPLNKMELFLNDLKKQLDNFKGKPMGGLLDHIKNQL